MTLQPCLDCGEVTDRNRCPDHRQDSKPQSQLRGYDYDWRKLSARARRLQPFCTDCGATDGLQADHTPEAWERKAAGKPIRLQDVAVVCGPCNRARGAARGEGARLVEGSPSGKANFATHTPGGMT